MFDLHSIKDVPTFGAFCQELANNHPPGTAEQQLSEAKTAAESILQVGRKATADHEECNNGIKRLSERLTELRGEQESETEPTFIDAIGNASADTRHHAAAFAKRAQEISFIVGAVEYGREKALPARFLAHLEGQSNCSKAAADLVMWLAVAAGVARYTAAQPLLETDGAVVFTATGRAFELFQYAVQLRADEFHAYEAWRQEQARQAELKRLKGIL